MKKYLRSYLLMVVSLGLAGRLVSSISFQENDKTILVASLVFTLINLFVKPILGLLLLPINLITLGFFRWLINVFAFYLVLVLVPQMKVEPYLFPGFSHAGFIFPALHLSFFWTLVLISFIISTVFGLLSWLFRK